MDDDDRWRGDMPHGRLVERIVREGSSEVNRVRACSMTAGDRDAQDFVRSYHPILAREERVTIQHMPGEPAVWGVEDLGHVFPLMIGGLRVHLCPPPVPRPSFLRFTLNDPVGYQSIRSEWKIERIENISKLFPSSIGCRVLASGHFVILYNSAAKIQEDTSENGLPDTVGMLPLTLMVDTTIPSQPAVPYGSQLSSNPTNLTETNGSCRVRLRGPDGQFCITTTTHAFVERPTMSSAGKFAREITHKAMTPFRRALGRVGIVPAAAAGRPGRRSPVGVTVYVGETGQRLGVITRTFDPHISTTLPYPAGYDHDLSLITGPDLPEMSAPPGYPRIVGWASEVEAASALEIFAMRNNVLVPGAWRCMKGNRIAEDVQVAHVEGISFYWKHDAFQVTRALLWRTEQPVDSAEGYSGTALCLGRPTDPTTRLIMFQNFQIPNKIPTPTQHNLPPQASSGWLKGGFCLPSELKSYEVAMGDSPEVLPQLPATGPSGDRSNPLPANYGSGIRRGGSTPLL